jgi:hypothetical protein
MKNVKANKNGIILEISEEKNEEKRYIHDDKEFSCKPRIFE